MTATRLNILPTLACSLLALWMLCACSTTRRIPDGQILYTGVKAFEFTHSDSTPKLESEITSDIKKAGDVKPNNPMPLLSPYVRTPLPIGLWVYNNWNDSVGGLHGWLYRKLVSDPVLISDVKPKVRTQMMKNILDNNGYFNSSASYKLIPDKKNPKKARILYDIDYASPYLIDSVIYMDGSHPAIDSFIDSLARLDPYLQPGARFCTDSLAVARTRITNSLRNRGYYYFRPEYIQFLADSLIHPGAVVLALDYSDQTPPIAYTRWKTGEVTVHILRHSARAPGTPDTIPTSKATLILNRPVHLRPDIIPECITFRKGRNFSVRNMDRTQTRLARLGIFSSIDMQVYPADTLRGDNLLNVDVTCRMDMPMQTAIEVNASSKSNSYLGPGISLSLAHNNLFGGAEQFTLKLTGAYEWQTGRGKSSVFNSYEFNLDAGLAFPRLLAPRFVPRTHRELNWTRLNINADLLNRPHYFRMAQLGAGITYEWRATRHTLHQLIPFKLTYNKLTHTTHEFDSIMQANPAVAESFKSQYIPQLSYTYTLDKPLDRRNDNSINFTASVTEAGNIFSAIYALCGEHGTKKLFGTPFSQFIKGQAQIIFNHRLIPYSDQWLVSRVFIGAAHAYGNSKQVPYAEQFYIGGANSIRAFAAHSLGPGSYRPPHGQLNGYFNQTGTFKLELNAEYRFPIVSILHGACFIDAGNVWLLRHDAERPGGTLSARHFLRDIALGTGVGLRLDIQMLVIRADLGYALHAPYSNGTPHYFNVGFKDAFALHLAIGYPF